MRNLLERRKTSAPTRDLSRPRRLHPFAIFIPTRSYSRPPRIDGFGGLIWFAMALLIAAAMLVDLSSSTFTDEARTFLNSTTITSSLEEPIAIEISNDDYDTLDAYVGIAILAIIVALIAGAIYRWYSFRWWIADGALWLRGGYVTTWSRRMSLEHIVGMERSASLVHKIIGVATMTIETTAVERKRADAMLRWLPGRDADAIEATLVRALVESDSAGGPDDFVSLTGPRPRVKDLFAASAFSFQISRSIVILWAVYSFLGKRNLDDKLGPAAEITTASSSPMLDVALPVLGLLLLLWLTSVLYFFFTFARFKVGRKHGWMSLESGLIGSTARMVRINAIHGYESAATPLQRRMGTSTLRMRIPGSSLATEYRRVIHPSVTPDRLRSLMRELAGMETAASDALGGEAIHRMPVSSRTAYIAQWPLRAAAAIAVIVALGGVIDRDLWWARLLCFVFALLAAGHGLLRWRLAGWSVSRAWIAVQYGVVNRTTVIAPIVRVQYLKWSRGLIAQGAATRVGLTLCLAASNGMGRIDRIRTVLHLSADSSLVTLPHLSLT
ncbi:MAG: PH domain-containing protein, partial [Thermomicrobiales bacterium]